MGNPVKNNPLKTRSDVEKAAVQLIEPLLPLLSPGKARLHLGDTSAVYPDYIAEMEAFARPLWAIVPMLAGSCASVDPIWQAWREGIINGVDPDHPEYWGKTGDWDQRMVEMAALATGMLLAPEKFFFGLPEKTQAQLHAWLDRINGRRMPQNNWLFFRVLVNTAFKVCRLPFPAKQLEEDFAALEEHYEGDGWYFDFHDQREYYTMWAFHYYGMIYARAMLKEDKERSKEYIRRGVQMAPDFACWFDKKGEAIPYGRSLTYRCAQSAFFSALALVDGESERLSYGEMKGLLLSNMRRWFSHPIFTRDGVLTIGYHYPSLLMAEGYNAPGSPYWAMKAFLCLALPENHPFWTSEEKMPALPAVSLQPHARMLITRSGDNSHVIAYQAGNHAFEHAHGEAKYEKFAYSTVFGFSVPKAQKNLAAGAFDSMLAFSEDGATYFPRHGGALSYMLTEKETFCRWSPMANVIVETTVIPQGEWHVRIHRIRTNRPLKAAEGGFAIARGERDEEESAVQRGSAVVSAKWSLSGIAALSGYTGSEIVRTEPNTNLMASRTLLPTLTATLPEGESTLICAVYGTETGDFNEWLSPPEDLLAYAREKALTEEENR